ncbi:Bug family tripartite tricarboxylate transporter substrate binding protein [Caldovatus aquaticus]|uniref:Tripartite tricarboxylate transporter substrate binding protein n=1 Tax=Caldovatus aquaticus TaxID=2865671 RepID=A0ABS7F3S4_9PROT|nr:tripartite tricarboxylate transporter substrate binding protein [Caldovatus aquaticus]MBW8270252.1 tripartite tricarboxylate transporter substrate binding protein [Caldovatus aquaticus]
MLRRRDMVLGMAGAAAAGGPGRAARAQGGAPAPGRGWPDRPIRWIVGYPPGGASDTMARLIANAIGTRLGQPIVVENRPGGGAVLASELVARSAPDGHTLLHSDNGMLVYNPALYQRLPYDPDRDLTGIGFIGRWPLFFVATPESPYRSFAELVEVSRRRPLTYGTPGVASPHHLACEMVKKRTGLEATHVPYRGGPLAMNDLLGGRVDLVVIDTSTGLPFVRAGRVRVLAQLGDRRSDQLADVPTLAELGHAGAVAYGWQSLSAPAGTPAPVIARLNEELVRAMGTPELAAHTRNIGVEVVNMTPEQFNAFVRGECEIWRPLIRELGIRVDG